MATVPWNEVKWAMANAKIGLKRDEICPGLTVDQHAESLAMFDTRNMDAPNKVHALATAVLKDAIKKSLLGGITEEEIGSLTQL